MELNENLLNIMPNIWSKQDYVQVFECASITLKKYVNMFERMYIPEFIYEVIVEPSYIKTTREDSTRSVFSRLNRVESDL